MRITASHFLIHTLEVSSQNHLAEIYIFLELDCAMLKENLVIHLFAKQYWKLRKPNENLFKFLYKLKITSNFALFLSSLVLLVGYIIEL